MGNETASFKNPQKSGLDAHAKAWADVCLGVGLWRAPLPVNCWLTLLFYPLKIHLEMREFLKSCGLTAEEVNLIEVFMLLYGYDSIEELMSKTNEQLTAHKGWDDEVEKCIDQVRKHSANS